MTLNMINQEIKMKQKLMDGQLRISKDLNK